MVSYSDVFLATLRHKPKSVLISFVVQVEGDVLKVAVIWSIKSKASSDCRTFRLQLQVLSSQDIAAPLLAAIHSENLITVKT